jgi:DNA polymerase III delta subunit
MDNAIHQAITDLSALIKDVDSKDAERIREIVERLQNFDAQMLMLARASVRLCNQHHVLTARGSH